MHDKESLADAAKRKARESSFASEVKRGVSPDETAEERLPEVEETGCYGFLRGTREQALHLEFRRRKGTWPAPGYAWLLKPVFDPDGAITLHFASGDSVLIRGRNLRSMYDRILRHKVLWIEEQGQEFRSVGSDALTAVYSIDYQEGEPK